MPTLRAIFKIIVGRKNGFASVMKIFKRGVHLNHGVIA